MTNRILTFGSRAAAKAKGDDYRALGRKVAITEMAEDFRVYDNGTYKDQLGGEWLLIVSASSIDPLT